MKSIKKIIIVNGYNYCGGRVVLSELCRCLNRLGLSSRLILLHQYPTSESSLLHFSKLNLLFTNIKLAIAIQIDRAFPSLGINKHFFPEYFQATHLKGCPIQFNPFFSTKRTIVIYPEVIYGNPLKASKVIRWFLYFNRYPNDTKAYDKNDMFLSYRSLFNDKILNPSQKIVKINHFDQNVYKQTNFSDRSGKCYIIRKGQDRADLPKIFDGTVVDLLSEEEKVKVFNQCEFCYCYDTQTFYSKIASICGCKTIVVPEPGKTRSDYRGADDDPHYGIAYSDNTQEIEWALTTRQKLIQRLDFEKENLKNTRLLVKYITEKFDK